MNSKKAEKIRARKTTKHSKQTQPNKNPTRTKPGSYLLRTVKTGAKIPSAARGAPLSTPRAERSKEGVDPHRVTWDLFFPRVRTPCGRSAQVIVERKGNTKMMGNSTQETKPPKNTQTKSIKPKHKQTTPKARGRFPIIQTVFPLYGGETGEKSRLHTI